MFHTVLLMHYVLCDWVLTSETAKIFSDL